MNQDNKPIKYMLIRNLLFDPENPRLPSHIDGSNEIEVINWMLKDATLLELMAAIGNQGYFPGEPILVVPYNENFIVVEGNRRLAAVKLLSDPSISKIKERSVKQISKESDHHPEKLPTLVFDNRDEILNYLGYRHVTGIKSWGPLSKAKYLDQLYNREPDGSLEEKLRSIARVIGSRSDYVGRLLTGLKLYRIIEDHDFYNIENLNEESFDFSKITTAVNYTNIADYLDLVSGQDPSFEEIDQNHLEKLTRWIFEEDENRDTRVGDIRNLRKLSEIVKNPKALRAFESGKKIDVAFNQTGAPADIYRNSIVDIIENLKEAQNYASFVEDPTQGDIENLKEINQLARSIHSILREAQREDFEL